MTQTETVLPEQSLLSSRPHELGAQSLYDKCVALASNLWWSWHPEVINLFRDLDPIRWRQLDHNPVALLKEFTPERSTPEPPRWSSTAGSTMPTGS